MRFHFSSLQGIPRSKITILGESRVLLAHLQGDPECLILASQSPVPWSHLCILTIVVRLYLQFEINVKYKLWQDCSSKKKYKSGYYWRLLFSFFRRIFFFSLLINITLCFFLIIKRVDAFKQTIRKWLQIRNSATNTQRVFVSTWNTRGVFVKIVFFHMIN